MEEHLVLRVDHLITPESLHSLPRPEHTELSGGTSVTQTVGTSSGIDAQENEYQRAGDEEEPLLQTVECRICQEEDSLKNLEIPCGCSGSLKDIDSTNKNLRPLILKNHKFGMPVMLAERLYHPGYTARPASPQSEDTSIDIRGWTVGGTQVDFHDPRLLAMAAAERRLLEADYDEYSDSNASGAAFFRSAALILLALLLLRHALIVGDANEDEDDVSTFFMLFLLRAAGFLLPCYIIAWAIGILQRRRQRQVCQ
uniref:RING-CH-type domain-containing protein n=1 Tax=Solanum lycopersicum TaxID=4081 RepID=A0A3Q7HU00_SOLLC